MLKDYYDDNYNLIINKTPKEYYDLGVDEYISGNYQDLQIDTLYPFMSSKDVKRLFTYIISKKEDF